MLAIIAVLAFVLIRKQLNKIQDSIFKLSRKIDHMAAVQIEQEDLDNVADALNDLTSAVGEIDTSVLPPADQTRLQDALTGLTSAVNEKLPVTVDDGDGAV